MSRIGASRWSKTWRSSLRQCRWRTLRYLDPSSKRLSLMCTRSATLSESHQLKTVHKTISGSIPRARSAPAFLPIASGIKPSSKSCEMSYVFAWKTISRRRRKKAKVTKMNHLHKESHGIMPLSRQKAPKLNYKEAIRSWRKTISVSMTLSNWPLERNTNQVVTRIKSCTKRC